LFAQGNPKALGDGKTYKNETGDAVYLFDTEQMAVLVAKVNKANDYKLRAVVADSLLIVRAQRIAVLEETVANDSTQIVLLQENMEIYQAFQPKWYQKFSFGFGLGIATGLIAGL